jgi:hypothetical protein
MARSNSAMLPKIWKTRRPPGVPVRGNALRIINLFVGPEGQIDYCQCFDFPSKSPVADIGRVPIVGL